jgi:hypothetical protein
VLGLTLSLIASIIRQLEATQQWLGRLEDDLARYVDMSLRVDTAMADQKREDAYMDAARAIASVTDSQNRQATEAVLEQADSLRLISRQLLERQEHVRA